jgi:hypothetical protein
MNNINQVLDAIYPESETLDDPVADKQCRRDFIFHMTDWNRELAKLSALYERPDGFTQAEAEVIVSDFLMHATAHVMEAARLLLDYQPGYFFESPKPMRERRVDRHGRVARKRATAPLTR